MCRSRVLALLAALAAGDGAADAGFDGYLARLGQSYSGTEYEERRALYELRVAEAQDVNARPDALWHASPNSMWHLTPDELRQRLGYNKMGFVQGTLPRAAPTMLTATGPSTWRRRPTAVDWRNHTPPVLTPVKNQLACGSCWAIAAAEAVESSIALDTGVLIDLSPQQLNSCVPNPEKCGGTGGCEGATPQLAFEYIIKKGITDAWQYPYNSGSTGMTGECLENQTSNVASIKGYEGVARNDAHALEEAVLKGPVSVTVDAGRWFMYSRGIFDGCNKSDVDLNHAVQLVGFGEDRGVKYWIVRNSWGPLWGERGFIRLRRYDQEPCGWDDTPQDGFGCAGGPSRIRACGECGLLADPVYAVGGYIRGDTGSARRLGATPAAGAGASAPVLV